jgi:aldehyde dehydrogenase
MSRYAAPGAQGSVVRFAGRYDHFIGGEYVSPIDGQYFHDVTPVTGEAFTEVAVGSADDLQHALDEAHGAAARWSKTQVAERAVILGEIADRIEDHLEVLAVAESWDTGKPVRETLAADLPLAAEQFRYFAGAIRAQEGALAQVDEDIVVQCRQEPIGVVAEPIPWDFPLLTAAWCLAPALAAGNVVVLRPARQTPASIHVLIGTIADLVPPGVINILNGSHVGPPRHAGPTIFFDDVLARQDSFRDNALASFTGGVALVQSGHYEEFMASAIARVESAVQGDPLDTKTTAGAQVSAEQMNAILSHMTTCVAEGARVHTGGGRADLGDGFYVQPTILEGGKTRMPQAFGPIASVTRFNDVDDALKLAAERPGRGAGVWARDGSTGYRTGRAIHAERVWVNHRHGYPAEAAFGRESRGALLAHYQRRHDLLIGFPPPA